MSDLAALAAWVPKFETWKKESVPLLMKGKAKQAFGVYPGALVMVTHDEHFAGHCTRTTWQLGDGKLAVL